MGPNWKLDGSEESHIQSLEISDNYCEDEEDMDTYLSDKEAESSCHSNGKRGEGDSTNAIYAIPCKNKKEEFPLLHSTKVDEKEASSHETEFKVPVDKSNVQVEENEPLSLNLKKEKSSAENLLSEKPPPSPDISIRSRKAWGTMTKEKFRELKQENWTLNSACQALAQRVEETKQQMEELLLKLKSLEKENRKLKEASEMQREEEAAELLSLREQAQELVDENDALKMTVHRLNVELSRYQTKFRPLSQEEHLKLKSLPMKGPPPPWLLDMKYLSPLLLAYEDRLREKDDLSLAHEEDMKNFKMRVEELVKENEDLHEQLNKNNFITATEWHQLQTQAKLVLEENKVLMEQLEIQQAKAKDNHKQHVQEVSKLTKKMIILEDKKRSQDEEIAKYQKQLEASHTTCEELKAKLDSKVAAEEHFALVNDLKSHLQQEQEKKHCEMKDLREKIASLQAQNKKLLLEKNNFMADNKILETELEMKQKTNRQLKKKTVFLKQQLEEAIEKEVAAHHYLTNLIGLVEKTAQERDHLIYLAKCLENENHGVLNKIVEGSLRLGRLEEKVKVYKKKASEKLGDISLKMTEQKREFAGKTAQYQQEMKHLQRLLQDKQETLDEVLQQKRQVEGELEVIWESTSKENRRMRELLHKSLEKNNMWNTVRAHEPYLDDVKKDLVYGHDFSYCDVKPSSVTNEIQQECQG
ncbi:centrosomal protein of 89 kDa [Nothoprocta perdicaria]|uniref:centrosomal protein of 89 kDa n=1 Tax=Nothoprocta perdicaria TaxID=30464 RepID=UPI000E1B69F0|nr:centrosomal protein of 89 kDa [Nothoprocta perdicaria]